MGLEVGGGGTEEREEEKEEKEKIPLCESIGHRPLRARCPKRTTIRTKKQQQEQWSNHKYNKATTRTTDQRKQLTKEN